MMLSYNTALKIINEMMATLALGQETVPLAAAIGRVCAVNLQAEQDIQPFDNAAMDGFAVRVADLASATSSSPVRLLKSGVIGAGIEQGDISLESGCCWHIMTGAVLPAGAEAVVKIEDVTIDGGFITFNAPVQTGQNIRYAGEDFKNGSPMLCCGEKITVAHILPLATMGVSALDVFKKPKILFISTGAEIVDDLSTPLQRGQIYNSNKFYACAFLTACGAEVITLDSIQDDVAVFTAILKGERTHKYDLIVSSGAVSAGSFDFVRDGLEKSGADILYHKINMKPGKPNLLAKLPSSTLYFGLPGNPVATAVGLRFFVARALRVLYRQKPESPFYARAKNGFSKKLSLHMILKGKLGYEEDGSVTVEILDGQESFKVSPFLHMDCWVHFPEEENAIKSGDVVEVFPLEV